MEPDTGVCALGVVVIALFVILYPRYWADDGSKWIRDMVQQEIWLTDSALCLEGGGCKFTDADFLSPTETPMHVVEASVAALHKRYLARLNTTGVQPRLGLFQIGANKLNELELSHLRSLNAAVGGNAHVVLVEPQAPLIPELTANAMSMGLGTARTKVVNAAMCPSVAENLTLWRFKDGFSPHPEIMDAVHRISSLGGKDALLNAYRKDRMLWDSSLTPNHEEVESWIIPVPVQCHTPATLLQELGMEAAGVDFILVDCEGYDAEVLSMFTELPGFDPAFIIMEFGHHHAFRGKLHLVTEMANYWSERGYAVYMVLDNLVFFKTKGDVVTPV